MKTARLFALGLALGPALAHAAAGQVLFALGRVEIQRAGQTLVAQRGTPVEVGDVIATGPTGMSQVRLKDGALLSLRYGSTMKVEEFRMPEPAAPAAGPAPYATAPSQPVAGTGGRSVLRLLRGAFRTVTGLIGKGAGDAYSVITPVATIGIRGTDYSAAYCNGDCGGTPDGLYVGVSYGEIQLDNDGGQLVLSNDQYGYVKDSSTAPDQELVPPEVLETSIAPQEGESEETSEPPPEAPPADASGSNFTEQSGTKGTTETGAFQPEGEYELLPAEPGAYAYATTGSKGSSDNGVYTDGNGGLTGFLSAVFTSIGTAQNVNTGFDEATGLRWGRWSGGTASVGDSALDLFSQSLHWVYDSAPEAPSIPVGGTARYTLIGDTNPTDSAGNVGFLGDAQLFADFVNGTVDSSLNININKETWTANGSGTIGGSLFSGGYSVTVNDASGSPIDQGASGAFAGFFSGTAAGLSYELDSSVTGTGVSGAAAFQQSGAP